MKQAWWKEAEEDAQVDELTRSSIDRVIERKSAEVRHRIETEKKAIQARRGRPAKLEKEHSISFYADLSEFAADTIRYWCKSGELLAVKCRGEWRITESAWLDFRAKESKKYG